jgi:hypothetical protein
MARVSGGYPPTEFSQKYGPVLAPKGKLVAPSDVFGEAGIFDKDVEEKTRQAFKVTMKKLDKLNSPVTEENLQGDLDREKIDQVNVVLLCEGVKTCLTMG